MRHFKEGLSVVIVATAAATALGQYPGNALRARPATSVQLPTFSSFSASTTVVVPDRGSTLMGGVNRSAMGSRQFGTPIVGHLPYAGRLFGNRAIGTEQSASSIRVSAYIHDFEAMDEYLLGQPADQFAAAAAARAARAEQTASAGDPRAGSSWRLSLPEGTSPAAMSVADAEARRAAEETARRADAARYFAEGQRAEGEGKAGVAKIYYQMAARRADGDLKQKVLARLDAIQSAQAGPQVARTVP